jgi:hypothetical protein
MGMIWYAPIVILLAAIDTWRMKRSWGRVKNINHWLSYLLAAVAIVALWFSIHGFHIKWSTIIFTACCMAIRGMLFDIALNLLVNHFIIRRSIDYISDQSNALNESRLTKIPFWWRRAGYTIIFIILLIINHFI